MSSTPKVRVLKLLTKSEITSKVLTVWTTRAKSVISALLLGAAATLGGTGSAQAAIYSGNWDPAFGSFFPDLGWKATATFDVPASCLALGNQNYVPTTSGPCAGFNVLSAQVSFYNLADPGVNVESFTLNPSVIVNSVDIAGGKLVGLDTGFFNYFVPTTPIAGGGNYSFSLYLHYDGTQSLADLTYANPHGTAPTCGYTPQMYPNAVCGASERSAVGTFTTAVPEPETYVLMLAGLAAVGFARRRRR